MIHVSRQLVNGRKPSIRRLCERVGMARQNFYAADRQRKRRKVDEELVLSLVRRERKLQPRIGARKLRCLIRRDLADAGVAIGRDRFFELLREHGLLVPPSRPRPARPTRATACRFSATGSAARSSRLQTRRMSAIWPTFAQTRGFSTRP